MRGGRIPRADALGYILSSLRDLGGTEWVKPTGKLCPGVPGLRLPIPPAG